MVKNIQGNKLKFSQYLRKNLTPWENKLWNHLRAKNLGVRFKRQVVIGNYIVDFCCDSKKLIIELDGGHHKTIEGRKNDQEKLAYLQTEGYKIMRFWNKELDQNMNKILEKILGEIF